MWLSGRGREPARPECPAELGVVTLGGDPAGVYLAGERRELPVLGPGGYRWRPALGQEVLVLKTGEAGELPCVAGARPADKREMDPGEVIVEAGDGRAGLKLSLNGTVELTGTVKINGVELEDLISSLAGAGGELTGGNAGGNTGGGEG